MKSVKHTNFGRNIKNSPSVKRGAICHIYKKIEITNLRRILWRNLKKD